MRDWTDYPIFKQYPWLETVTQVGLAVVLGLLIHALVDQVLKRLATRSLLIDRLVRYTRRVAQFLVPLLLVQLTLTRGEGTQEAWPRIVHLVGILIIMLFTALLIRLVQAFADVVEARHPVTVTDNLQARSIQTQVRVLSRTVMFAIGVVGAGSVLMTFPNVRQVGASLLASAGVAGIVAGLAARPVLGNLIAGMQIALAQPIRIDDVLIVENEWGRVEEITSTYVVVRIWDERRLVVPLEYFIQKPFQNWTRRSSDILGSVFLWVDFRMPIEPLRQELKRVLDEAPEWDKRVWVLQVTDLTEQGVQLRALMSSADASRSWDLRCRVREALVAFIQANYPDLWPQTRAQLLDMPEGRRDMREAQAPLQPGTSAPAV